MTMPRVMICRRCGAARDSKLDVAMCRDCYNANQRRLALQRGATKSSVFGKEPSAEYERQRLRGLERAYTRLGLEVGKVKQGVRP